ncbi:MAG: diguanylate cyclase [Chloroflexi bacterium]|nr:diguanylate cyclase [Chloroflexota bacterium]
MNEIHTRPLNAGLWGRLAIIAIVYWAAVRLGLMFVAQPEGIAAVWPASGLALAVLLLYPKNQWAGLLAAIFVVNAAGNWSGGNTITVSLGFALANTVEPFLGAWVLTSLCGPKVSFGSIREVLVLFGTAIVVNGFTALIGAAIPALAFDAPFMNTWMLWWTLDGLGIILVTPFIVTLFDLRTTARILTVSRLLEAVFVVVTISVFAWLLFGSFTDAAKPLLRNYMVFPLLIWLGFRFRIHGMTGAILLFAAIAIWHTVQGHGIFAIEGQAVSQHLISLQVFLSVVTFSGLLLSALIAERKKIEEALKASSDFVNNLIGSMQDGISVLDNNGVHMDVNQAFCRMTGFSREELIGTGTPHLYWPEEEKEKIQIAFQRTLANEAGDFELTFKRKNGERFPVIVSPFVIQDGLGRVVSYSATVKDITNRKQAESILRMRLELSQFADSHSLDELLQKTLDDAESLTGSQIGFAHFLEADQKTLQLQMWSTNTLKNMCTAEGKGEHYSVDQAGVWTDCVATRTPVIHNDYPSLAHRKGLPEGHAPILRELVVPVLRNNRIMMLMGVGNKPIFYTDYDVEVTSQLASLAWDIIQRKRAEDALRESTEMFSLFMHYSPIYTFIKSVKPGESRVLQASENYQQMIGVSGLDMVDKTMEELFPPEFAAKITADDWSVVANGEVLKLDEDLNGRHYTTIKFPIKYGEKNLLAGYTIDITNRVYAEKALEAANLALQNTLAREKELARTDPLTGINNRRCLIERAEHELDVAMRYQQPLSVILFDIDHFKNINDTFGHLAGDQILQQVTQSACAQLRSADVIGRYGGEEFVILLPMTNAEQALSLAERIREDVVASSLPTPKGQACVTLSVGIVELSLFESLEDVLRRADEAMYAAKQAGRNCARIGRK